MFQCSCCYCYFCHIHCQSGCLSSLFSPFLTLSCSLFPFFLVMYVGVCVCVFVVVSNSLPAQTLELNNDTHSAPFHVSSFVWSACRLWAWLLICWIVCVCIYYFCCCRIENWAKAIHQYSKLYLFKRISFRLFVFLVEDVGYLFLLCLKQRMPIGLSCRGKEKLKRMQN